MHEFLKRFSASTIRTVPAKENQVVGFYNAILRKGEVGGGGTIALLHRLCVSLLSRYGSGVKILCLVHPHGDNLG